MLTTEQHQINALREWYDQVWKEADDVSAEARGVGCEEQEKEIDERVAALYGL